MGQTIPICKTALTFALLTLPSLAVAKNEDFVSQYANARLAEIGNRDDVALKAYLKLYRNAPDSEILADRLFDSAIRSGDMPTAVRAARARELRNGGSAETALLLFVDAFQARNWAMADLAADEITQSGNFAFMSPILKSWTRVAQSQSPDLPEADPASDPFFAYYSSDQRIYLDMASGQIAKAKLGLRQMVNQPGDHVRDLMITGSGVIVAQGDDALASALLRAAMGNENTTVAEPSGLNTEKLLPSVGIAALYSRIATALLEQNVNEQGLLLARIAEWIAPASASSQIILARALRANGMSEYALPILDRVPASSPYWLIAVRNKVDWLVIDNQITQAAAVVASAEKRAPKSVAVKMMIAQVQQAAGQLSHAIDSYRALAEASEAANVPPRQQASYRILLASVLDDAGNWSAAQAELEKILSVDPNNGQAMNYLGYSLLERNVDTARATAMVKRAYEMNPDSSAVTDSLGWAYYRQGDLASALPLLEKAAKAEASDATINEHLGDAYWSAGRRRDARYAWQAAVLSAEGDAVTRITGKIDLGLPSGPTAP